VLISYLNTQALCKYSCITSSLVNYIRWTRGHPASHMTSMRKTRGAWKKNLAKTKGDQYALDRMLNCQQPLIVES
jgi:hypothetical protein